ncbi:hypothetical protein ATANTOWER_013478 [Ataeniobius toweri]|uniref:Uncharacterized protein n=1 Tax=Ataeniobius toweri TaxID=208326 RepID=A0ABU7A801_9TELE|nr:hypothetical protein [Ataeniobius toweri]
MKCGRIPQSCSAQVFRSSGLIPTELGGWNHHPSLREDESELVPAELNLLNIVLLYAFMLCRIFTLSFYIFLNNSLSPSLKAALFLLSRSFGSLKIQRLLLGKHLTVLV